MQRSVTKVALISSLPTFVVGQAALDEHGVDDRQRGRRERGAGDQRCLERPVEQEVRDERGDDERAGERGNTDPDRRPSTVSHVIGIDLHPCEEGEHDRGELGDEVEPLLTGQVEDVADDDAKRKLDQRDGDAKLDRDASRRRARLLRERLRVEQGSH